LLTAGYADAFNKIIAGSGTNVSSSVQGELTKSFASAADTAQRYPNYSQQIVNAARQSFIDGQRWAYFAGIVAIVLGAVIVRFFFPGKAQESELLAHYHEQDTS
jgi:hypothetical protein